MMELYIKERREALKYYGTLYLFEGHDLQGEYFTKETCFGKITNYYISAMQIATFFETTEQCVNKLAEEYAEEIYEIINHNEQNYYGETSVAVLTMLLANQNNRIATVLCHDAFYEREMSDEEAAREELIREILEDEDYRFDGPDPF